MLKTEVIAETGGAYLIENIFFPGNYLIIPNEHVASPLELSDSWWQDVKILIPKIPEPPIEYNLYESQGKSAGQTLEHVHLWVVPRVPNKPSSGKGLYGLMREIDESKEITD
jgi:diadenosine tetraphosphate (Ap4A) HIT family hydrolase